MSDTLAMFENIVKLEDGSFAEFKFVHYSLIRFLVIYVVEF